MITGNLIFMHKPHILFVFITALFAQACNPIPSRGTEDPVDWNSKRADLPLPDSLKGGKTYLSVYSQIYSQTAYLTHDMTCTISMRNTSERDTLYLLRTNYFNTNGESVRTYFDFPILLVPLETVEIVIDEVDREGGTGANFIFDWKINDRASEPLFEAVMISTTGSQGLSFTTTGVRVDE